MSGNEPISLGHVAVLRTTPLAMQVLLTKASSVTKCREFWIPKSVIHDDSEVFRDTDIDGNLVVKTWWAEKNGFV